MLTAWRRRLLQALAEVLAVIALLAVVARVNAAGETPIARKPPPEAPAEQLNDKTIAGALGDVINWYRGLALEERLVEEPAELLAFSDNREQANEILKLAFGWGRAQAALLARINQPAEKQAQTPADLLTRPDLIQSRSAQINQEVEAAKAQVNELQTKLASAPRRQRDLLTRQLTAAQGELELALSRADFYAAMGQFEGEADGERPNAEILGQIDELERSVALNAQSKEGGAAAAVQRPNEPSGLVELARHLLNLQGNANLISGRIEQTNQLAGEIERLSTPLHRALGELDQRARSLANQAGSEGDRATIEQRKRDFQELVARRKLLAGALLPLRKAAVLLRRYVSNLGQWRVSILQHSREDLHTLAARLIAIGLVLGLVLGAGIAWRRLTVHYVEDVRRRRQILKVRNGVIGTLLFIVLLLNFISELGALATVLGFAAAGIAVALQDLILAVAGYFRISGRFGIKIGDRVELQGVRGDVIDIGLLKLTLMELSGDSRGDRGPTGRVVVIPNSTVFREKFVNQAPGSTFSWDELRLTLAPDCDYRLAEKRIGEVVEEVFGRYREAARRQSQEIERLLNIRVESFKPQSRLQVSRNGVELTIRYPVDVRNEALVADEISRRLLDSFAREPGLRLVPGTAPNIQAGVALPSEDEAKAAGGRAGG